MTGVMGGGHDRGHFRSSFRRATLTPFVYTLLIPALVLLSSSPDHPPSENRGALRAWLDRLANALSVQRAPGSEVRASLLIVTAFWVYVAVSDALYANSMQWIVGIMVGRHIFAPLTARLLQHLILYPVLVACIWASLCLGWRPILSRIPLQ